MSTETGSPTIVVGYDGSDSARAALLFAARQAGSSGSVFIVHAYELPPDFLGWPNYDSLLSERRGRAQAILDAVPLGDDELAGPDYHLELIGGPPAAAIADVARARQADEIVVGARGLGRVRSLIGSVSHELLHVADRPVVVIPTAAITSE
jgi:nucleotide-binding universal stress UspA family protein